MNLQNVVVGYAPLNNVPPSTVAFDQAPLNPPYSGRVKTREIHDFRSDPLPLVQL